MNFDDAFAAVIDHEKGLSLDPRDRGNWTGGTPGQGELKGTKYGISARAYPEEDIANVTLGRAKELYLRDYWTAVGCHVVPEEARFDLFDMAVNSGVRTATRTLQSVLGEGVDVDGVLGPQTLGALGAMPPAQFLARFNGARLMLLTNAPTWNVHGKGWVRRVATNLLKV